MTREATAAPGTRFGWLTWFVAGAAVWSATLWVSRFYRVPVFVVDVFLSALAVGTPSFAMGVAAARRPLRHPMLSILGAYCLGSGVAIAFLHGLVRPDLPVFPSCVGVGLVHTAALTLLVPDIGRGFVLSWGNAMWLALVASAASVGLALRGTVAVPDPKGGSRRVHPRRGRTGRR